MPTPLDEDILSLPRAWSQLGLKRLARAELAEAFAELPLKD